MKSISKSDLVKLLGATSVNEVIIIQRGECKMNKTNNPFYHKEGRSWVADYDVEKESRSVYDFGGSYEDRVNEALVADGSNGTFKAGALAWGEWEVQGRVIRNGEKLYVRVYVKNDSKPDVSYFVNGKAATKEQIAIIRDFTPEKKASSKQLEEGLAEEKQIIPNNVDFDKIVSIEIDGIEYTIS